MTENGPLTPSPWLTSVDIKKNTYPEKIGGKYYNTILVYYASP